MWVGVMTSLFRIKLGGKSAGPGGKAGYKVCGMCLYFRHLCACILGRVVGGALVSDLGRGRPKRTLQCLVLGVEGLSEHFRPYRMP